MLMVIAVENTHVVLGLYAGDELRYQWRIATDSRKTEDEYGTLLRSLFASADLAFAAVEGIIVSSVVPPLNHVIERMCLKYFRQKPLIVGPGIKTGLNIKSESPREVGADRIVNAVAGIHYYGTPLIVVAFGTATTFCYVDEQARYWGGAIAPGIVISTEALVKSTAKLPRIELAKPAGVIGRNTVAAMQAGIYYGVIGQVEGIVQRMKAEAKQEPFVVATGELAELIAAETGCINTVDAHLTLKGLRLIYERNR
ncbi:type III pantothenate kinase [Brevibacillus marinus]|uniref:type III pantothenate kinase n=1 Tax=Brevibacillus marinus TaxID=2496837 RepID=UPI000F82E369|nr:type III pantothenate kinase [Brevibacillus marinus]